MTARDLRPTEPWILAGLSLWGIVFASRFWDHKLLLGDEGVAVLGAQRILEGQVPGRDFFEIIPPFSFLPTALAFRWFGATVAAERGLALLLAALLVLLVDRMLKRCGSGFAERAFALALLVPFGVLYWPVPSHHWWADLLQLGVALCLLNTEGSGRPLLRGLLAGLLSALALFSLQDQGALFVVALCALFWVPLKGLPAFRRLLGGWTLGLACGALPLLGWLLATSGWRPLWDGWIRFPLTAYRTLPSHRFDPFAGWREVGALWSSGLWSSWPGYVGLLTLCSLVLLLLPVVAGVVLVTAWRRRTLPPPAVGLLGALALAFAVTALRRWSLTNAVWAAPGLLVAVGSGIAALPAGRSRTVARWGLALGAVISFFFSVALYRLGASPAEVVTSAGTLRSLARADAAALSGLLDAMETVVPPGEPVFCAGFHSMVNFLSGHPNPSRFNAFVRPLYSTDEHAREVAARLATGQIRWVVGGRGLPPRGDPVGDALRARFRLRYRNPGFGLLEWDDSSPRGRDETAGSTP